MNAEELQRFHASWNRPLGSVNAAFAELLASQSSVDVTLACEGQRLHCHRLVLSVCSTFFDRLLSENYDIHPFIELPGDIKLWEIRAIIDFMYKGEVSVPSCKLTDFLECAEKLEIRDLYR